MLLLPKVLFGLQTSVESHVEHTCGIIIDSLKHKDAGKWQCHLDFEDKDTGQTGKEVQEYTFKVAEKPKSEKLCGGRIEDINVDEGFIGSFVLKNTMVFLSEGSKSIRRGYLARQMYDWLNLRYVSFDFKIWSGKRRSRRTQTVALISAERRRKCCKERNAILGVWIGNNFRRL